LMSYCRDLYVAKDFSTYEKFVDAGILYADANLKPALYRHLTHKKMQESANSMCVLRPKRDLAHLIGKCTIAP
jgi:hypothetical protein